ncbi:MAG TPA: protein kinase [Planctomycetota bacterium]|nr:protein kinase [Planctomycetota bacterium]
MSDPSLIGRQLGAYRVVSLLGKGGMGEVYLAHDARLARDVALKLLPADLGRQPDRRARLLHEARAAASLNHPNITTIHEIGEADGRDYIALECVQGRTLHELLADHPLSLLEMVDIALPLADALAYAHERGVIHRDIKASNVMVSERGLPKLLDFGLAKVRLEAPADPTAAPGADGTGGAGGARGAPSPTSTLTGTVCGTPGAMSPEQALGEPLDERSDVFSFGSLLYEMACRRAPFAARTAQKTMHAVIHDEPEPLSKLRPDLPPELVAIVTRALRKKPADRYPRMSELAGDLRQFKRQTESGLLPPARRRVDATRRVAALLGLALAGALGWGGWTALRASRAAADPVAPDAADRQAAAELPAPIPDLAAVMHFDNLNDAADSDQLGAMLALLLTTNLSSGSGLQMVSQQRLFEVARKAGSSEGRVDRGNASDVARRAGIGTMILGQIGRVGEQIVATAEIVDVGSGRAVGTARAQGGSADDLFRMAESLGDQVRLSLDAPAATTEERRVLTQQLTSSVDAWRAYVLGEQALHANRIDDAEEALRRAVTIDPGFALAHFRLAMALTWSGRVDETRQAIERALAFRDRLPADLRELLDATRPYHLDNDTRQALPYLLKVVEKDPHQRDALEMLGEIYTHSATLADSAKAAEVYDRMLESDPTLSRLYDHALSAELRQGKFDRAREMRRGWQAAEPAEAGKLVGELALWEGRFADAAAALGDRLDVAVLAGDPTAPSVTQLLGSSVDEIAASLAGEHGVYQVLALDLAADALVYHGRFDDAAALYLRAAGIEGPVSPDGFLTNARNGSRHRLAFLLAERGDLAGARRLTDEALALQPDNPRCLYLSTLFAARQGDLADARAHVALLDELLGRGWGPMTKVYQQAATAELDLAEGRTREGRDRLQQLVRTANLMDDWYAHKDSVGPLLREALARSNRELRDAGAESYALDGLLGAGLERLRHPVPWVTALYRRGCLDLDAGRLESGRVFLERFLSCWGEARAADGAELPEVADARARLMLDPGPAR